MNPQTHKCTNTQIVEARRSEGNTETDGKPSPHIVLGSFIPQTLLHYEYYTWFSAHKYLFRNKQIVEESRAEGNEESYTL